MAQPKRIDLTSLSTQNAFSKTKEKIRKTNVFQVKLENNNGKAECEFSWLDLLANNQNESEGRFAFNDCDTDNDHLKKIAKRFEKKYGEKPSEKKKRRIMDDFIDLGDGYDLEDSFIDNGEAYDEVVPHNLKTKCGGFYINTGKLDFNVVSDDEILIVKGKRKGGISSMSEDSNGANTENDEKQALIKKNNKSDLYWKKRRQTVDNLIKVKKKKSMVLKRKISDSSISNTAEKKIPKIITPINNDENLEDTTPKWKKDQDSSLAPDLPTFINSDLKIHVEKLKKLAEETKLGKCRFFSDEEVSALLLKIWMFCKVTSIGTRRIVFEHLAAYLPCSKDTLMKRAKNLAGTVSNTDSDECSDLLNQLREEIERMMPEQEARYNEEKEAYNIKTKQEEEQSSAPVINSPVDGKVPVVIRKKFKWTKDLRNILNELIRRKMQQWQDMDSKVLPADEFLKKYLEHDVKKVWPKGWIQVRALYNDTRMIHKELTGGEWIPKPQRIKENGNVQTIVTTNASNLSQSPTVDLGVKLITNNDTPTSGGSKLLDFAKDSLMAVAKSKERKKIENEEKNRNKSDFSNIKKSTNTLYTETKSESSSQLTSNKIGTPEKPDVSLPKQTTGVDVSNSVSLNSPVQNENSSILSSHNVIAHVMKKFSPKSEAIDLTKTKPKSSNIDSTIEALQFLNQLTSPVNSTDQKPPEQNKSDVNKIRKAKKLDNKLAQLQQQRIKLEEMQKKENGLQQQMKTVTNSNSNSDCYIEKQSENMKVQGSNYLNSNDEKSKDSNESVKKSIDFEAQKLKEEYRKLVESRINFDKPSKQDFYPKQTHESSQEKQNQSKEIQEKQKQNKELLLKQKQNKESQEKHKLMELQRKMAEENSKKRVLDEQKEKKILDEKKVAESKKLENDAKKKTALLQQQHNEEILKKKHEEFLKKQEEIKHRHKEEMRQKQHAELVRKRQEDMLQLQQQQAQLQNDHLLKQRQEEFKRSNEHFRKLGDEHKTIENQFLPTYTTWNASYATPKIISSSTTNVNNLTHTKISANKIWNPSQPITNINIQDFATLPELSSNSLISHVPNQKLVQSNSAFPQYQASHLDSNNASLLQHPTTSLDVHSMQNIYPPHMFCTDNNRRQQQHHY